jgi:hypothetical protein
MPSFDARLALVLRDRPELLRQLRAYRLGLQSRAEH